MLGLCEMRWKDQGKLISADKTILFSGNTKHYERGVGLLLNRRCAQTMISWEPIRDRLLTARFQSRLVKCTVVRVYAPTNGDEEAVKDSFYTELDKTMSAKHEC